MKPKKYNITKELLIKYYKREKKNSSEIAQIFGCCNTTILYYLKNYGIKIRSSKENAFIRKIKINKKFLIEHYIEKKESASCIAKIYGCERKTIIRRLKEYDIKLRTRFEERRNRLDHTMFSKQYLLEEYIINQKSTTQISKENNTTHFTVRYSLNKYNIPIRNLKVAINLKDRSKIKITKQYLMNEYVIKGKSTMQIAKEFGCSGTSIFNYLKKFNISIRNNQESHIKLNISRNYLVCEYINKKFSIRKIANKLSCSEATIFNYLKKFNIKIRKNKKYAINKKLLENYIDDELSYKQIAKAYGCSEATIFNYLKKFNIKRKIKINKPESHLKEILQKISKNKFEFVGNRKFFIKRFNPDFVDFNNKKIIEMYGDYWHNLPKVKKRDKIRYITYKNEGYNLLVIWEHELKNLEKLKNKIINFVNL